ncbi:hypothetical protein D3C84_350260 [compost metagenome]
MLLDLRQAHGRIDRHRHAAGEEDAEEAEEEIAAGRQHQRHPLPGAQAALLQAAGNRPGALLQGQVADVFGHIAIAQQAHMNALRVLLHMPVEHLGQGLRGVRREPFPRTDGQALDAAARPRRDYWRGACQQCLEHIAGGLRRGEQRLRQAHAELALDPRPQLDPGQAVQPQIAVEYAVQADGRILRRSGTQLDQRLSNDA